MLTLLNSVDWSSLTKRTERMPRMKVKMEDRRKHHHFLSFRHSSSLWMGRPAGPEVSIISSLTHSLTYSITHSLTHSLTARGGWSAHPHRAKCAQRPYFTLSHYSVQRHISQISQMPLLSMAIKVIIICGICYSTVSEYMSALKIRDLWKYVIFFICAFWYYVLSDNLCSLILEVWNTTVSWTSDSSAFFPYEGSSHCTACRVLWSRLFCCANCVLNYALQWTVQWTVSQCFKSS